MVDNKDLHGLRSARTELTKRGIDISRADLRCMHGTLYIRGQISLEKSSHVTDVRLEMEHLRHILRQKPDIRDVVLDCQYPGA